MNPRRRPLEGRVVNLSISQGEDAQRFGLTPSQVNRVTLQIAAALLGQGASLVFGHDWRRDGVMEAIYGFARQVQAPAPLAPEQSVDDRQPLLRNLLPWPEAPFLPERDIEQLSSTLKVERAGLPPELLPFGGEACLSDSSQRVYRYLRARGLTFLRRRLNDESHARVCVGGRRSGYEGRYPGVVEEAFFAIAAGKPLYLAGFLGGAAEQVIDAVGGKRMTDEFCRPTGIQALYDAPPIPETSQGTQADRTVDPEAVWGTFAATGITALGRANGLSQEENEELFHTPAIERAIELVLAGLSRIRPPLGGQG